MSKKAKLIWFLMGLTFILFLYLIITSESIKPGYEIVEEEIEEIIVEDLVDVDKITTDYKNEISRIFKDYLVLVEQIDAQNDDELDNENESDELIKTVSVNQITFIKVQLLSLTVPTELKNLHLDLVFSVTMMENYLENKDLEEKIASQELIDQIKISYDWLK